MNKNKVLKEIDADFEEKFCQDGNWKGYWEEVDVYSKDVKTFLHQAIDKVLEAVEGDLPPERKVYGFDPHPTNKQPKFNAMENLINDGFNQALFQVKKIIKEFKK